MRFSSFLVFLLEFNNIKMTKKIFSVLVLIIFTFASAQTELVFVFFKDKPNKAAFYANPLSELSQKSDKNRANLELTLRFEHVTC